MQIKDFVKFLDMIEDELIGKSHNIIRHPNTKRNVFEELWKTIKDEKKNLEWNNSK